MGDQAVPFAILTLTRSGSTHLVKLLDQHPLIRCNQEPLNANDAEHVDSQYSDWVSDDDLIAMAFTTDEPVAAIGCKLMAEQLRNRPTTLNRLWRLPTMRFIVLERRNQLAACRSLKQAKTTGVWNCDTQPPPLPRVRLDPIACLDRFLLAERSYQQWRHLYPTVWLYYDDLIADQDTALTPVWNLLGVPDPGHLTPVETRLETRPLADSILNWDELQAAFTDSPYKHYLELPN